MSKINNITEPWNGHTRGEVEEFIKGGLLDQKHLTQFKTDAEFEAAKATLDTPNVSLVGGDVAYTPRDIPWGAYLHADGTVDNTAASDVIGICVIPSSHYGKARFMSVVRMSASSNQGTTTDESIKFANTDDGFTLKPTSKFVGMDLLQENYYARIWDPANDNYLLLPTDRVHGGYEDDGVVEGLTIPSDWDASAIYWLNDGDNGNRYAPSPFLANGKLNPKYATGWPNCLSDVEGKKNTGAWLAKSMSNYPAALACHNFAPGFGEWYLPAVGELAYLAPRWGAITDKLTQLAAAGCRVAQLGDAYFWSSSAYSPVYSWCVFMYNGYVNYFNRDFNIYVLAFSAL